MALDFPSSPSTTDIHNAANGLQYVFDGVKWISQGTYNAGTINAQKLDSIASSFNGVLTTFNLKVNNVIVKPASAEALHIVLAGHLQEPATAYTINSANGTITFASAPSNGTAFFGVILSRLPIVDFGDGTVTNAKVAANAAIDGTKINPNFGSQTITGVTTTQGSTDNTTKLASTAFVQTAISNLVDSSPDTLNTLNELAAALGDDASFSTTVTTALAAKAPLASPTFTGTVSGVSYNDLDNLPTIPSQLTTENVQDIVGAMVTGNTETGISVTYDDAGDGTGKLNFAASTTNSGNQTWNDNAKAVFGSGGDLEIYHDATDSSTANHNSIISETGGGGLLIYASDIIFHKPNSTERLADFAQDGAARLYYDGGTYSTPKLATSATGVTVDGTVTATAFSGDGSNLTGISSGLSTEQVQDIVGAMFSSNTETNITATYQDSDGTIDLVASSFSVTSSNVNAAFGDTAQLILGAADGDGDDALKLYYGTGSGTNYGVITADNGVHIQFDGTNRLETHASGTKWIGDLNCDDNQTIKLGSSADLTIKHDQNNSIIEDSGAGALLIYGSDIIIQKSGSSSRMADFAQDGAVRLYENGTIRLTTTDAGISVAGNIVVSGTVDGVDLQTLNTAVSANTSKTTNATHSGEVTGSGALTIADNVVDEANLKVSNSPTNGYVLTAQSGNTGGLTWSAAGAAETATTINALYPDNGNLILGTGTGNDTLKLYYDGTNGKITSDNAIHLQQDGANKLEISSSGTKWIGDLFCDDNQILKLGSSADLQLYHDGTSNNSFITEGGSGSLVIKATNTYINAANDQAMIAAIAGGAVELYHDNSKKFETQANGITVTGGVYSDGLICGDSDKVELGNSGDLEIYHDGSNSIIDNSTGVFVVKGDDFRIKSNSTNEDMIRTYVNGAVELYHANSKRLETQSWGTSFTGNVSPSATETYDLGASGAKWNNAFFGQNVYLYGAFNSNSAFTSDVFGKIIFDTGYSTTANGPNKIIVQNDTTGGGWYAGFGISPNEFGYYSGGHHVFYTDKTNTTQETGLKIIDHGAVELYFDNSKKLETGTTYVRITGDLSMNNDGHKILLGASQDLQLYHDGANSYLYNLTGDTIIQGAAVDGTSKWLYIKAKVGENSIVCKDNGAVELYYDNVKKFETENLGVKVYGHIFADDNNQLRLGNSGDLQMWHDGLHSYIYNDINTLYIRSDRSGLINKAGAEWGVLYEANSFVQLYYDNSVKLQTESSGVKWTGDLFCDDNSAIKLGSSADLRIYHDGGNSYISDQGTGSLIMLSNLYEFRNTNNSNHVLYIDSDASTYLYYNGSYKLVTESIGVAINGVLRPAASNSHDLGASDRRWATIYAVNALNTSDENEKKDINNCDLGLDFVNKINPVSYKWKDSQLGSKTHYGLLAQNIEDAVKSEGKTLNDFGAIHKPEQDAMALNYNQLIAPLVKAIQELSDKVAALEAA